MLLPKLTKLTVWIELSSSVHADPKSRDCAFIASVNEIMAYGPHLKEGHCILFFLSYSRSHSDYYYYYTLLYFTLIVISYK